ncbi:monosaccharide ABC transporter ATP-binding protein (CUT2 family) [Murinocardiopsis flavida]|uniref:Monosaccharide ABC transporter ATP-binding protein (CUT2 family) n=1 Tax=Murinocardiopsis flavida TaxID=645275 RepID=A0A2P8CXL3_9ACTN|nr:ATP-binding cassette domain-containing protein [Murinocardiopsis flavida]PSK89689.1 monosaccharide ABC transporter ATP-binding protein (CUT2 family) [Murinocardiopsis flavida]
MITSAPQGRPARAAWAAAAAVLRRSPLLLFTVLTVAVFAVLRPDFLSIAGFLDIGQQIAVVAVIAFAMTAVIVARGIDISVGATLAVSGVVAALVLQAGAPAPVAMAAAVLTGAAIGTLNGVLVGLLGVSPLIATLGTMAFGNGAALALSGSSSVGVQSTAMLMPGGSYVGPVPSSLIIALVCMAGWALVLRYTLYGRWLYAVGGNIDAARSALAPARLVQMSTFVLSGAFAGLGAIIMIGRVGSAQPLAGQGLEFAAITAVVVGGAKLSGGVGGVGGTMLGATFVGVITAGLSFLQLPQQAIYVITGLLVIVAVLATQRSELAGLLRGLRRSGGAPSAGGPRRELALAGVGKRFPGVRALHDVTFSLRAGEVTALAGENGAGKSTLVKVLAGVHEPDSGRVELDGTPVRLRSADDARAVGVSVIHQHFSLVPDLTVLHNLFLGREPTRLGALRLPLMRRRAAKLFADLELGIDPDTPVAGLTVGEQQLVEVAKAMLDDSWLIVMDEPTSALSTRERERLYALVRRLVARDVAVLYISHKMEEVFDLCDRVVVLRDGAFIGERATADIDEAGLITMMVGRTVDQVFPHRAAETGEVLLEIDAIGDGGRLRDASLTVRAGEVVALAGLMGSGRSEVLRCAAGLARHSRGRIAVAGAELRPGDRVRANGAGVAYVPEDRHREGIVQAMSVADNIALAWLRRHSRWGLVPAGAAAVVEDGISRLGVKPPTPGTAAGVLSGGNQQKVVLARWLATEPRVLLLDEPTNGVDVGAKAEIHGLIADLKDRGIAVLMVSSELPEVLGVADRIVVMHAGRTAGELPRGSSEEEVMALAFGRAAPAATS